MALLNQGDPIPGGEEPWQWAWNPDAYSKFILGITGTPGKSRGTNPTSKPNTGAQGTDLGDLRDSPVNTMLPGLSSWLDRFNTNLSNIGGTLGITKNTSIPGEVFQQNLAKSLTTNFQNLENLLGNRVQHFMTLSPTQEAERIQTQWNSQVLPEISKLKTDWIKSQSNLEMKMAKALGSQFLSTSSAKDAEAGYDYAIGFMNQEYTKYSNQLASQTQALSQTMMQKLEGLLPSTPTFEDISSTMEVEAIGKTGKLEKAILDLETGRFTFNTPNGSTYSVDAEYVGPQDYNAKDKFSQKAKIAALNSNRAPGRKSHIPGLNLTYSMLKTEYDNRRSRIEADRIEVSKAYENLRAYLRETVGKSLTKLFGN